MAMPGTDTKHGITGINVTPLIDVLLVLLIIFMVIVPVASRGLQSNIPQSARHARPDAGAVVVEVLAGAGGELSYLINQTPFAKSQIETELANIFASRQQKVMFVKAGPSIEYAKVAEVIDMGHQASVDTVSLITPGMQARQ
jgi:biopolymer transport protein ExbD/biopolymer transport protein TolR